MLSAAAVSCRTTTKDVQRWANIAQGPRKLVAVLTHEKFPLDLRVEAGMTLVSMKPLAGRRIGITELEAGSGGPDGDYVGAWLLAGPVSYPSAGCGGLSASARSGPVMIAWTM